MKYAEVAIGLGLMLALAPALALEPGVALKDEVVRKEPYSDAKQTGNLRAGDKVSIVKRNGGWLNVKSAGGNGWVRMLSVRKGGAAKGKSVAESLQGLASGRAGSGHVVATTGIRGLNEEELKAAKFNEGELKQAESFALSKQDAQRFAAQGKLKPRSMDYLPVAQ